MQVNKTLNFEEKDGTSLRLDMSTVLDLIEEENKRYAITRRGKTIALLVPIDDKKIIEENAQQQKQKEDQYLNPSPRD